MQQFFLNRWVVLLMILPHISIYLFKIETLKPIFQVMQLGVFLPILLFLYTKVNLLNILVTLLMGVVAISAYLNGTLSSGIIFSMCVFVGFCFYIAYAMSSFKELITGLYYLLGLIVVGNFLTMIASPLQIDGRFLLGGKNTLQLTLLPAISLIYLYSHFTYDKLRRVPLILILISIISLYLSESGTAIVISLLSILFVVLPKRFSPSFNTYLVGYILFFFAVVIYRMQEVLFGDFIRNVLKKDLTFTNRTYIWDLVLQKMEGSWLLGLGRGNTVILDNFFISVNETHNGGLEVLMYSGVLGLILFIATLFVVGSVLKPFREDMIGKVLSFSLFAYLIIGLTESVFYRIEFWMLIFIAFGIGKIMQQKEVLDPTAANKSNAIQSPMVNAQPNAVIPSS